MRTKSSKENRPEHRFTAGELTLLVFTVLLLIPAVLFAAWYLPTRFPVTERSNIRAQHVEVQSAGNHCTLEIPSGTLTIRRPERAAVGSSYGFTASVQLDSPMRLTNCSGSLPVWNLYLEGQTTLVAAAVQPYALIRQPASNREQLTFEWTFTPEEEVAQYTSHLYLRAIVMEQDQTVERWNLLVRDFPMENAALFDQPTVLWLAAAGVSALIGLLLFIILLQKRR